MYLNYNFTDKTNIVIFSENEFYNYQNGWYNFKAAQKIVLTENLKQTKKDYLKAGFLFDSSYKKCSEYKGVKMEIWKSNKNKYVSLLHTNFILSCAIENNILKID